MTSLKNCMLGIPTGPMGNLNFKIRKGKPYVSTKPIDFKKSMSPKAVEVRDRMRLTSPMSKAFSEDHFIKSLWERSDVIAESTRNKIYKINFPLLAWKTDISAAKLLPVEKSFDAVIENCEWSAEDLKIRTGALSLGYNTLLYPEISVHGVIHFYDRKAEGSKLHSFIHLTTDTLKYQDGIPLTYTFQFTSDEKEPLEEYNSKAILIALIIRDRNQEPVYCSGQIHSVQNQI